MLTIEIKLNVNVTVVKRVEDADMVLVLEDYDNLTKNKIYNIYYDDYDNPSVLNNQLDSDNRPLLNYKENILLSISVNPKY